MMAGSERQTRRPPLRAACASRSDFHWRRDDHRPAAGYQQPMAQPAIARSGHPRRLPYDHRGRLGRKRRSPFGRPWNEPTWSSPAADSGPTADDLTREALARLAGTDLVLDEASLAHIRALFARRKRPMPERNVVQAMFPRGSRPIPNPEGTAPGIHLEVPRPDGSPCHLFAVPGVPAEMQQMWEQSVVPALVSLGAGQQVIRHRRIKCFGVGESDLEQMLPDLIRRGRTPLVGITVHDATITLRITATAPTESECLAQMEPTIATIRECLGTLIFGGRRRVGTRRTAAAGRAWAIALDRRMGPRRAAGPLAGHGRQRFGEFSRQHDAGHFSGLAEQRCQV